MEIYNCTHFDYISIIVTNKSYRNRTYHYNVLKYFNLRLAECVDVEALRYITRDEIIQLLNKKLLGTWVKFVQYVKEWQKSIRGNTLEISAPKRLSESVSIFSELIQPFNLENILSANTQVQLIVNYYSLNNNLNESCRNLLVDLIIATIVDKKISMTVALVNHIATVITKTFTSEVKVNDIYTCIILLKKLLLN
jgi:hypothetical protein